MFCAMLTEDRPVSWWGEVGTVLLAYQHTESHSAKLLDVAHQLLEVPFEGVVSRCSTAQASFDFAVGDQETLYRLDLLLFEFCPPVKRHPDLVLP